MKKRTGVFNTILTFAAVACLLSFAACDAFKDYYEGAEIPVVEGEEGTASADANTSTAVVPDFASDKTACEPVTAVTVSLGKDQAIIANMGWTIELAEGETVQVEAKKLGEFTTQISIVKGDESGDGKALGFTAKQVGETTFNVCDVTYKSDGAEKSAADIDTATIVLDSFNEPSEGGKVLNSGYYNISFAKGVTVTKDVDSSDVHMTGAYYTEELK